MACTGVFNWRSYQDSAVTVGTCEVANQQPLTFDNYRFTRTICVATDRTREDAINECLNPSRAISDFQASVLNQAAAIASPNAVCFNQWISGPSCVRAGEDAAPAEFIPNGCP
jgi:hypothetical protein